MKKKIISILIITFFVAGSFSVLADNSTVINKQDQNFILLDIEGERGYVIDENNIKHDASIEINGDIVNLDKISLDFTVAGSDFDDISFSLSGYGEYVFVGYNDNSEEMYSLFVKLDEVEDKKDNFKPYINHLFITQFFSSFIKNHPSLFSIFKPFQNSLNTKFQAYSESKIQDLDITLKINEDGTAGVYGYYKIDDKNREVISTLKISESSVNSLLKDFSYKKIQTASVNLNVPYRWQFDLFFETFDYDRAKMACGPACAAMMLEYYTRKHVSLNSIVEWRDCKYGWSVYDVRDYLNEHISDNFSYYTFSKPVFDESMCKNALKSIICIRHPIMILCHVPSAHWVVIDGFDDDGFYINNPAYHWSGHLWFCNSPFPWDTLKFKENAFYGEKAETVNWDVFD